MKLATATNSAGLETMINKYFYSENYQVAIWTEYKGEYQGKQCSAFKVYNQKLDKFLDNFYAVIFKGRWIFANTI